MNKLNLEAVLRAYKKDNLDDLQHLVPSVMNPNSRVEKLRIGNRTYSSVPILCITISFGSRQCFDYLIEKGASTYYADIFLFLKNLIFFRNE